MCECFHPVAGSEAVATGGKAGDEDKEDKVSIPLPGVRPLQLLLFVFLVVLLGCFHPVAGSEAVATAHRCLQALNQ